MRVSQIYMYIVLSFAFQCIYSSLPVENLRARYIDLLISAVLNTIYDPADHKENGTDWPKMAHSMIGKKRMNNLKWCVENVIELNVPGDLVETGVWQGGATIVMRGILKAWDITDRKVWVCDSFQGLPAPSGSFPIDVTSAVSALHTVDYLKVSVEQVARNFEAYDLLDEQVKFLKGWFKDTMPTMPIERIAVLRLDGDMYESTIQVLEALYNKVSIGGYIIIDDYCLDAARAATNDFRKSRNIQDQLIVIDNCGVYWKKTR